MSLSTEKINLETDLAFDGGNVVIQQLSTDKKSNKVIVLTDEDAIKMANAILDNTFRPISESLKSNLKEAA